MKLIISVIVVSFTCLLPAFAQSWLEGTWNVRFVGIDPQENDGSFIEISNAITFSNFTGQQISFTAPSDDGSELTVFSVIESGDLYHLKYQDIEGASTDFELLRAFRISDQLAFISIISFGGNGESLEPIYFADAIVGIMSKGPLPSKPSTVGLSGDYRGFSFGVDVNSGLGFQEWTELLDVTVSTAPSGYLVDPNDGEPANAVNRQNNYVSYSDYSQHNLNSTGDFDAFYAFPITNTMVASVRLEGLGEIFEPFINYNYVNGEAGLLSKDPNYEIPDFINTATGNGLPSVLADARPIADTPGWFYLDWFKGFKPSVGSNWIYHGRHGWLFYSGGEGNGIFLWDSAMSRWLWTTPTAYPWMYAYGPNEGWVFFFEGGRPGSRFFKRGDNGQVVSENDLGL